MELQRPHHAPELLTVVMPVYNEQSTIRASLERLVKTEFPLPTEILVIDDGSTDRSIEEIGDLVESGRVKLLRHPRNRGKGAAVRTAIDHAAGDVLTIFDADLEYDPGDLKELLKPILDGEARVVYGTRSFGAHTAYSFWFVIGNHFLSFFTSFLFNTWISDIETCFKVVETRIWRSLRLRSNGFGIEAETTGKILKAGHRIFEVPIQYKARSRTEGKKLQWTDGLTAIWLLLRTRFFDRVPDISTEGHFGATRGYGLLENFLASRRAKMADSLIPSSLRNGRILDLGCGTTPKFLLNTSFAQKIGVEKRKPSLPENSDIEVVVHDVEHDGDLPFESESFDVVTMLAVFEHLEPHKVAELVDDVHRLLKPGGVFVMTTPASWTDPILEVMSDLKLVSAHETDEHKQTYSHHTIKSVFEQTDFGTSTLQLGYFEAFMNIWATAKKL
jgi:SAM-dependent methyltransferase